MIDVNDGVMYADRGSHILIEMRNHLTVIVSADNQIDCNERPFYHGLLLNRQQVQQIIDNSHLFDAGLVNAAYLLANVCDTVQIKYDD